MVDKRPSVKRPGCVCEDHDHVPDSWFPDYCNTCSCRCKQTAPSQSDSSHPDGFADFCAHAATHHYRWWRTISHGLSPTQKEATEIICPSCYRDNPLHSNPADLDDHPSPGDISICFACASIGIFTEDGVRKPTAEELAELLTHDNIIQAQKACRENTRVDEALTNAVSPDWVASDLIQELP